MPTFQVVAPCHKDLVLNSAFASDYGDLISNNRIDAWIYGHSHTNIDAEIGGTKVLSNQMGYVFQNEHLMNGFDSGKYENKKIFFGIGIHSTRWKHAGFMSLLPYTWREGQSGLQTGNIPVSLFQIILRMFRIIMNTITMNGAGKLLPVFLPICADWWMPLLPMLMASMNM